MPGAAISVQNLTKTFPARNVIGRYLQKPFGPKDKEVLRGVTLEVSTGEVLGLLGPNGGGVPSLVGG